METRYITISKAIKEAFWFKKFVTKLSVMSPNAIILYCDNNGTIAIAKEPMSHQKFKYIK